MLATEVLVDGLDHPEGVAWAPSSDVLWAGGEAGQLYRVDVGARTWQESPRAPGWRLTLLDVGLTGAPLHYPDRWGVDA